MTTTEPTPSLSEYRRQAAEDPNTFWRLQSGDHLNLLEEAIEENDRLRDELAEANKWIYWSKANTASTAEQHKRHYDQHDQDREAWQQVRDELTSEILDLRAERDALAAKLDAVRAIEPTLRRIYATGIASEREVIDVVDELIGQALRESATTPPEGGTDA